MIQVRPSNERGQNKLSWLDTRFTFSFDQYYDPEHMQFRSLRVLNEDIIAPGQGFGMHPHRDMEILTWILDGALEHRDSMGTGAVIRPGELQHMTAGSGILHSEFNPSAKDSTHLLQIWIVPDRKNLKPEYEQLTFPDKDLRGKFHLVAGPQAPVSIHQDANLYIARLNEGEEAKHSLKAGRSAWMQVSRGAVDLNGTKLKAGDGAAISEESEVRVEAAKPSEVLLFDLA
ncbi:MAG TPA: pirin family protein [Candidatus Sulfotelmatobacter sp.]|jgi:redox-sensitive bicupin YhaK (pirin superfamily)|nr:pirin family protein [Candidatus Sulfotelmatobacter sp.]